MYVIHHTATGVICVSSFKLIYWMIKPASIMTFSNQQSEYLFYIIIPLLIQQILFY